jgi:hypothetical protein
VGQKGSSSRCIKSLACGRWGLANRSMLGGLLCHAGALDAVDMTTEARRPGHRRANPLRKFVYFLCDARLTLVSRHSDSRMMFDGCRCPDGIKAPIKRSQLRRHGPLGRTRHPTVGTHLVSRASQKSGHTGPEFSGSTSGLDGRAADCPRETQNASATCSGGARAQPRIDISRDTYRSTGHQQKLGTQRYDSCHSISSIKTSSQLFAPKAKGPSFSTIAN